MAPARDLYRDTWVRYLGYANEVGEALRALVDVRIVRLSYVVAFGYTFADTGDKAWNMSKSGGSTSRIIAAAGDALIWQTLASVIIPGYIINRFTDIHQVHYFSLGCVFYVATGFGVSYPIVRLYSLTDSLTRKA